MGTCREGEAEPRCSALLARAGPACGPNLASRLAVTSLLLLPHAVAWPAGNIQANSYAWSENAGWINFAPASGPGVTVGNTTVTGFAWSENLGWISLAPIAGGVRNNGSGTLSGYAWGENAGWINFAPSGGGVAINGSGQFGGLAWGENVGWMNFSVPTAVITTWRPSLADAIFSDSFE